MKSKWRKRLERSLEDGLEVCIRLTVVGYTDLHGFVLGLSDELVLLFVFHDFHPDGCQVVRMKDIEKVRSGEVERQSERLLAAEGLTKAIGISEMPPLDDMKTLLTYAQEAGLPVIVEDERPRQWKDLDRALFLVGYVSQVKGKCCWVHHFDALGRWDEKPTRVKIRLITCVHLESPFVAVWLRHIEACPTLPDGDGR